MEEIGAMVARAVFISEDRNMLNITASDHCLELNRIESRWNKETSVHRGKVQHIAAQEMNGVAKIGLRLTGYTLN